MENNATTGDYLGPARLSGSAEGPDVGGLRMLLLVEEDSMVLSAANHPRPKESSRPLHDGLARYGEEQQKRQHRGRRRLLF